MRHHSQVAVLASNEKCYDFLLKDCFAETYRTELVYSCTIVNWELEHSSSTLEDDFGAVSISHHQ